MGFRKDAYMTVWSVEPSKTGATTKVRLSASKKNQKTNEYEQDFSGFCTFIGKAHEAAGRLKEKDRIKVLSCDVSTSYDKVKKIEYVNYKVFEFEMADGSSPAPAKATPKASTKRAALDDGEVEVEVDDSLPF